MTLGDQIFLFSGLYFLVFHFYKCQITLKCFELSLLENPFILVQEYVFEYVFYRSFTL